MAHDGWRPVTPPPAGWPPAQTFLSNECLALNNRSRWPCLSVRFWSLGNLRSDRTYSSTRRPDWNRLPKGLRRLATDHIRDVPDGHPRRRFCQVVASQKFVSEEPIAILRHSADATYVSE